MTWQPTSHRTPKTSRPWLVLVALFLLPFSVAQAQSRNSEHTLRLDEGKSSPPATLEDVAWLAGYWRGEGLGGRCEEIWAQPTDGRMFGVFSLVRDSSFVFSEAMVLAEEEGTLVLKIKHFDPDFVGWEEKDDHVTFRLVRAGDKEVFFSGLTFRRQGDELLIYLVLHQNGKRTEHEMRLRRVAI